MRNTFDTDEFQRLFKGMQSEVKLDIIAGLRDPDPEEREASVSILRDKLIPALQYHRNPVTARMAVSGLSLLIAECRIPRTEEEDTLLDEAIFVFCLESLKKRFQQNGGK